MAKDKLTDYDATASNNTDVGGISVAEGMLPSGVNNAIREQMSHLADFASGTSGVDVLKLQDDTDTNSIKLQAPASVTSDTTFTLPDGDGSADQVLKTDGAGQLGFADRHANPSLIINGAMQVAQRGTSATGVGASNGVFPCVDRMKIFAGNTAGRATVSQVADVHDGFANALKFECTTADTSIATDEFFGVQYVIEGQDVQQLKKGTSDAESLTLSFYVKGNASATYTIEIRDLDNDRINTQTFAVTTSWNRISLTFIPDTTGAFDDDNAGSLQLSFWLHAGSTYTGGTFASNTWASRVQGNRVNSSQTSFFDSTSRTFFITGVKLEVGSTATDFVHSRSYGEELALCQRYYQQYLNPPLRGTMSAGSAASRAGMILPVPMRATPSVTMTQTGSTSHAALFNGAASYTISSIQASYLADFCIEFDFNLASAPAAATPAALYQSSTLQSKFAVSAEL